MPGDFQIVGDDALNSIIVSHNLNLVDHSVLGCPRAWAWLTFGMNFVVVARNQQMGDSVARTNFDFAIVTSKYNAVTRLVESNADVVVRDIKWVISTLRAHALVVLVPMSSSLALVLSTTSRLPTVKMNILTRNATGLLRKLGRSKLLLEVCTQKVKFKNNKK